MNRRIRVVIFALVMPIGLGSTAAVLAASQGDMKKAVVESKTVDPKAAETMAAIKSAEAAQKRAASVKGEWRDTGKFIKQAKAAAKEGDFTKALKLAKKAKAEGHLGYEQAVAQKELRLPSYLKY